MSVRDSQVTERRHSKLDIRKPRLRLFDKERNEIDTFCHNAKIAQQGSPVPRAASCIDSRTTE